MTDVEARTPPPALAPSAAAGPGGNRAATTSTTTIDFVDVVDGVGVSSPGRPT
ncbi:hypothetical protein K6U06_09625 [Acidiferrimicrobium sp. IK]|uniref:hypothetical protein n=1 Tax=Acidiferrimicrobium sp. IK TaxID=2871700 RepID=UPI0021CB3E28|nr:hypothetical protein [Acidiferrimicrobium sp. IK]MCU4184617.1 hypothetical protein [Acidiferrimicrobium sp. IK]